MSPLRNQCCAELAEGLAVTQVCFGLGFVYKLRTLRLALQSVELLADLVFKCNRWCELFHTFNDLLNIRTCPAVFTMVRHHIHSSSYRAASSVLFCWRRLNVTVITLERFQRVQMSRTHPFTSKMHFKKSLKCLMQEVRLDIAVISADSAKGFPTGRSMEFGHLMTTPHFYF